MDNFLQQIEWQDVVALLFFVGTWTGYAIYSSSASRRSESLLALNNRFRLQWMQQMLRRDNRMVDATMVGNLMRNINFFANTSMFIVLGLITMLGYHDRAAGIISAIPHATETSPLLWEIKILLLMVIFVYAFFKYTWSIRQYTSAGVFITAAPFHNEAIETHAEVAEKGAYLVGSAGEYYNDALRAYYYGLSAFTWLIHPWLFMATTVWITIVTYRREFRSRTLKVLRK